MSLKVLQENLSYNTKERGYHLITSHIEDSLSILNRFKMGVAHIFLLHTSASLTINESVDPTVREDMKRFEERLVPRDFNYIHDIEGSDDMPAHIKSSLFGCSLNIPVKEGRFCLGTWQGIYLCEHRDRGGRREMICTITGE